MTSSPSSLLLADFQAALLSAVAEVAENSLFAFADASDQTAFESAADQSGTDDWLDARIRFTGPVDGQLTVALPGALARRLCAAFAGADSADEVGERDLIDFTGELANMVCGTWLTRTCQHDAFTLMPPIVQCGGPERRVGGSPGDTGPARVYVAIDDTPLLLEIDCGTAAPNGPGSVPGGAYAR